MLKIFFLHLIRQEIHDEYTCSKGLYNKCTIRTFHILPQYKQTLRRNCTALRYLLNINTTIYITANCFMFTHFLPSNPLLLYPMVVGVLKAVLYFIAFSGVSSTPRHHHSSNPQNQPARDNRYRYH